MRYQLVIFDFDGTLADSYPWFLTVYQQISERFHIPLLEAEDLEKLRSLEISKIMKEYKIPFWKLILMGNHLKKLMNAQIENIPLVDGMQNVLDVLRNQQVKLAVVTSNSRSNVQKVLGQRNKDYFQYIESGASMYGKKARFEKILRKTGIPAEQTLCIGDEVRDLKSSRAAKIAFGAVGWGYTNISFLEAHSPEAIFTEPSQIIEVVNPTKTSPAQTG